MEGVEKCASHRAKARQSEAIGDAGTRKEWVGRAAGCWTRVGRSVGGLIRFTGGAKPKGLLSIGCR